MREAQFLTVFVGIETPEADALKAMRKEQNAALPMLEAIRTLNSYGLEVTSGIILGLDTDTADTEGRLKDFIELSQIPMLTINLLQALPRTPLWDRLKRDGRLIADDAGLESNVRFLRPYDEVVATWRRCIAYAYDPERLFARFTHQVDATYANRMVTPARGKLTIPNLRAALVLAFNVVLRIGFGRITAGRSGAPHAMRCAAARSMRCWAWDSSPIISSNSRARRCVATRTPRFIRRTSVNALWRRRRRCAGRREFITAWSRAPVPAARARA